MKLLELINRTNLDMSKQARMKRAEAMGFDTSTVWYHANTGGIEGEGFDDERLPASDPDRPFNAHWFSHEPNMHASYPSSGNTLTPVFLALRKEAPYAVWRKITAQIHKAWDGERNAADMIREKLVSMGYTHAIRGREPIDADELERTGETSFKTSTGEIITLKWEKLMLPGGQPEYNNEEKVAHRDFRDAQKAYNDWEKYVIDAVVNKTMPEGDDTKAKGVALRAELERAEALSNAANDRAWGVVNDNREEIDHLEMYDSEIGHVTGYTDLADYERMEPEKEDIAVLDPSIIRSIHAAFDPAEDGNNKIMSSLGESQLDDDYERGHADGRVKGIEAGKAFRATWDRSSDGWNPEFNSHHDVSRRGRITKANAYEKAFSFGYQDGYYDAAIGIHDINEARGPHEGNELKLMLAGKKPLAMIEIDRESPEKQEVWNRLIKRGSVIHKQGQTFTTPQPPEGRHQTDFIALPGEEWRIDKIQALYDDIERTDNMTNAHHVEIGQLLGYSGADIKHFVTGYDEHGDDGYTDAQRAMVRRLGESEQPKAPHVAYHATFPENRDNIRIHGLDPKYSDTFEEGAVFFYTGGTPDPKMDIWKADLRGLDIEYDATQVDDENWWYTHDRVVPDKLELVQKGKAGILGEAPIRDFDVQPSATTPDKNTWGARDKKKIANPSFETLARKKVKTAVPIDMVIMGIPQARLDLKGDNWIDREVMSEPFFDMLKNFSGVVSSSDFYKKFGVAINPAPDAITSVFISNTNDVRGAMPISPWILCHRLAHSIMDAASKKQIGDEAFNNAYPFMNVTHEYLTMRSAQPGKAMANAGEKGVEALAQFIHNGKITLARVDEAKTLALGMEEVAVLTNGHEVYGNLGGDEDVAVQDLDEHLEDMESQLNISGKILVEACIGMLVVAP